MKSLTFIIDYNNKIYSYDYGSQAMIFDYGVNNDIDRKFGLNALEEYVNLVFECYLKDSNDTPLGKLCDYVAQHWKKLKNKSRYDILDEFYLTI